MNNIIDKKYERLLFSFIMAIFMSGFMSLVVTLLNLGFIENLIFIWLDAYWKAFLVAFPTILVVIPRVRKIVSILIID